MKSKILRVVFPLIMIVAMLLPAVAAAASLRLFSVVESAHNNYAQLPVIVPISNTGLVAQGKIASDGLNTVVSLNGTAMPRMIADDKTLFASPILADSTTNFVYSTKDVPDTSMPIIVGHGGYVTVPKNIELGSNFQFVFEANLDTSAGSNKVIIDIPGSLHVAVDDTTPGTVTAILYGSGTTTISLTDIPSNVVGSYSELIIKLYDGTFEFDINGAGSADSFSGSVTTSGGDWTIDENNVMPYIESITLTQNALPVANYYISEYNISGATPSSTGNVIAIPLNLRPVANSMCSDGTYLYVLSEDLDNLNTLVISKIRISDGVDLNDLAFDYNYGSYDTYSDVYTNMLCINGGYLYFAEPLDIHNIYFQVDKISTSSMTVTDYTSATGAIRGICCDGSYVYYVSVSEGNWLEKLNQSDLTEDTYCVLSNLDLGDPTNVACGGGYVYIVAENPGFPYNAGLVSFYASDLTPIIIDGGVTETEPTRYNTLIYQSGYVYFLDNNESYGTIDKYPEDLATQPLSSYTTTATFTSISSASGKIYVSRISDDISDNFRQVDPSTMELVSSITILSPLSTSQASNLIVAGTKLYVSGNSSESGGSVEVLRYQPVNIISGSTLIDEDGTQDGVIHYGSNPAGIAVTNLSAPNVTTEAASNVLPTSATLNGTLLDLGGYSSAIVSFEYGVETTPQTYPSTVSLSPALTVGQPFPANITNLQPNATYHYQAIADVGGGVIVYGGDQSFKTTLSATSSTTVTISKVGVFQDYTADGDMLFTAEIFCNYPPYNAQGSAFKYFNVELMDTDGTTVIAVSPLMMWGDRPESIYLKPSIASTLILNAPYQIKVIGVFSGAANPYATHTILPDDWNGSDKIQLDAWCIEVAKDMEVYDNKAVGTYVVSSTDNNEVITDTAGASGYNQGAGGYFTMGIPQISVVRPNLFQVTKSKARVVLNTPNNVYDSAHVWDTQVGTQISSDFNTFGKLIFGDMTHGASVMGYLLLVIAMVICVVGIGLGGKGLPLLVLSFPLILWGTEMGAISIRWLLIPCVAMVMLWARQFWVKPT